MKKPGNWSLTVVFIHMSFDKKINKDLDLMLSVKARFMQSTLNAEIT